MKSMILKALVLAICFFVGCCAWARLPARDEKADRALADVIPNITGRIAEQVQQVNLAAFGIPFPPGTPLLVGPFAVFDARALATGNIDLRNLNLLHSRSEDVKSAGVLKEIM